MRRGRAMRMKGEMGRRGREYREGRKEGCHVYLITNK